MRTLVIAALTGWLLAACNTEQYETIYVAVYPSTKSCAIKDKPLDCGKIGEYLRDALKATANREIAISYVGTETAPQGDTSLEQIADLIKKVGYRNVRVVRYDMK
jgi:hypothetical protein